MTSCSTKSIAILYGVGPGLGLALARAFAPTHTLALLSRTRANIEPLVDQLKGENSAFRVHAFESDPTEESLKKAVEEIGKVLGGGKVDLGIWNASARPAPKPFLETKAEEYEISLKTSVLGPVAFSRVLLPLMLANEDDTSTGTSRGTLLFTGATASLKGSAQFSAFAVGKFGLRAFTQSLAREFGPQGVHVGHVIVDSVIGKPGAKSDGSTMPPESIARAYKFLYDQDRSTYTAELDVRPSKEKW